MLITDNLKLDRKEDVDKFIYSHRKFKKNSFPVIMISAALISFWIGIRGLYWLNLLVLSMMIVAYFATTRKLKRILYKETEKLLMINCDAQLYFFVMDEISRLESNYFTKDMLLFNKVNVLSALGAFIEANELLDMINADKMTHFKDFKDIDFKLWYQLQKFFYYAFIKDKEHMRATRYRTKELESKISSEDRMIFDNILIVMEAGIFIAEGNFIKGKEALLNLSNDNGKDIPLIRVLVYYFLGYLDVELGNFKEAKERLQYVIDAGNTLYVVDRAKELMKQYSLVQGCDKYVK